MDSIGGYHVTESNGKLFLVYYHPKYHPIAQTQSPTSFGELADPFQPLFLCPRSRIAKDRPDSHFSTTFPITSSPECLVSTEQGETTKEEAAYHSHSVLPLFWCNNKNFDVHQNKQTFEDPNGCYICWDSGFGTDYYLCSDHDRIFHKECVQSPSKIKHPYHPEHSLQLYFISARNPDPDQHIDCLRCGRESYGLVYMCTTCDAVMHPTCGMKLIPFVEDQPKTHHHPLTFFPRQTSLTCNVCGLLRENFPTYICARCNFVAHNDCMYSPRIIKISRHPHRISYVSSLLSDKWSCGVCRKSIDSDYGSYTCKRCGDYAVHTRCAVRKNVWDGIDLEGVPEEEEEDITKDPGPFEMISEGKILHFLHDHELRLEVSVLYDENKLCQACGLPIYEGNLYFCVKCDFVIHETCANNRRRIQQPLHPHPLTLKAVSKIFYGIMCKACHRRCGGFVYNCPKWDCHFNLDVRCASISEPFDYHGHKRHPLFRSLGPKEKAICKVCKSGNHIPLNCIKCDFIVCMKCATLPYEARYKYDKHLLKILVGEQVSEKHWCEVCERNLGDTDTKMFYWCNECSTTLHIKCLLGKDSYLTPGQYFHRGKELQILCKSHASRPLCDYCKNPCQGKIYKCGDLTACSFKCGNNIFKY